MNPEPIIGIRTPHGKQHLLYARSGTSIWRYCIFCTFGMQVACPTVLYIFFQFRSRGIILDMPYGAHYFTTTPAWTLRHIISISIPVFDHNNSSVDLGHGVYGTHYFYLIPEIVPHNYSA